MFVYQADGTRKWVEQSKAPRPGGPFFYSAHNGYYDRFHREDPQEPHWTNRQAVARTDRLQLYGIENNRAAFLERIGEVQHYATGPGYPGPVNVVVPTLEMSGRLTVGFSRNASKFVLPRIWQYVKSQETTGLWMKLANQESARVVSTNDFMWGDGQSRPSHDDGLELFNLQQYLTQRYDVGYNVGWKTVGGAPWPIHAKHQQIKGAQAMTLRSQLCWSVATTTSNWATTADTTGDMSANHYGTAAAFAGGQLDQGTSTSPFIKIFLDKVAVLVNLDTNAVVEYGSDDVEARVTINPHQAHLWAESSEVHEYIKGSYWAQKELAEGTANGKRPRFGLPSQLYGYPIDIENATRVTTRKGDTLARSFIFPDQQVLVSARVGGLEGVYGAPSFSTLTWFWYNDELTVETFSDNKHRRDEGHVVQDGVPIVTAPVTGYLLTSSTSVAG